MEVIHGRGGKKNEADTDIIRGRGSGGGGHVQQCCDGNGGSGDSRSRHKPQTNLVRSEQNCPRDLGGLVVSF